MSADGNILKLHDLMDAKAHKLRNPLNCHAVRHMDPVRAGDEETMGLKEPVSAINGRVRRDTRLLYGDRGRSDDDTKTV